MRWITGTSRGVGFGQAGSPNRQVIGPDPKPTGPFPAAEVAMSGWPVASSLDMILFGAGSGSAVAVLVLNLQRQSIMWRNQSDVNPAFFRAISRSHRKERRDNESTSRNPIVVFLLFLLCLAPKTQQKDQRYPSSHVAMAPEGGHLISFLLEGPIVRCYVRGREGILKPTLQLELRFAFRGRSWRSR